MRIKSYLDSGLIVRRSLILFEIDLSNIAVAAVEDPYFDWHKQLEMDATAHYLNSGVMLMNLEYMRIHSIQKSLILQGALMRLNMLINVR